MKYCLVIVFALLTCIHCHAEHPFRPKYQRPIFSLMPVTPYDWFCQTLDCPTGIHARRMPVSMGLNPSCMVYEFPAIHFSHGLRSIHVQPPSLIFIGTSAGIPFADGAIFCRIENYCLRYHSVKISVHAGGFTE